ncbi:MAG: hypothetical protein U5L11_01040 [Arhodomonas sp.]|nr:hypothetical protein [Arhodomonas sp.]
MTEGDIQFAMFTVDPQELRRFRSAVERLCANWQLEYTNELQVLDGTRWFVEIQDRGLRVSSGGDNAFPDNWEQFMRRPASLAG